MREIQAGSYLKHAAQEDTTTDDSLISFGDAIKALGNGKVGGYLVLFGSKKSVDLSKEFFSKSTDYDIEDGDRCTVYYDHALDGVLKDRKLGKGSMRIDDAGVWLEAQLQLRDDYEKNVYKMAEDGKLGWSSGTAPHLVKRKSVGDGIYEITAWPLGLDASLTPTPCNPDRKGSVIPLKKYVAEQADEIKSVWTSEYQATLPDSSFAYIDAGGTKTDGITAPSSLRHFPFKDKDGKPDAGHIRNALARIPQSSVSDAAKAEALAKVEAAAKELGISVTTPAASTVTDPVVPSVNKSLAGKSVVDFYRGELAEYTNGYTIQCAMECALNDIDEQQDAAERLGMTIDVAPMVDQLLTAVMADLRAYCLQRLDESGDDEDDMDMPMASNGYMMSLSNPLKSFLSFKHDLASKFPLDIHSKMLASSAAEIAENSSGFSAAVEPFAEHAKKRHEFRIKDGRTISAATREHLTTTHDALGTAIDHATNAKAKVKALIDMSAPKPKAADAEKMKSMRRELRLMQARELGIAI